VGDAIVELPSPLTLAGPQRPCHGVQPDTLAATALLDACARNGKMDMARR